jgi:hypothetical protein
LTEEEVHIKTQKINRQSKLAYIFLIVGLLFVSFAPFLFTQLSHYKPFDFSNTGQIGDTIGGVTAPFINLIAVLLIYFSFRQQLLSNEIQISLINDEKEERKKAKELELINLAYADLKNYVDNFQYVFEKTSIKDMKTLEEIYKGEDAIYHLIKIIRQHKGHLAFRNQRNAVLSLISLLHLINTIIEKLDHARFKSHEKLFLINQLNTFFQIKIFNHVDALYGMKEPEDEARRLLNEINHTSQALATFKLKFQSLTD